MLSSRRLPSLGHHPVQPQDENALLGRTMATKTVGGDAAAAAATPGSKIITHHDTITKTPARSGQKTRRALGDISNHHHHRTGGTTTTLASNGAMHPPTTPSVVKKIAVNATTTTTKNVFAERTTPSTATISVKNRKGMLKRVDFTLPPPLQSTDDMEVSKIHPTIQNGADCTNITKEDEPDVLDDDTWSLDGEPERPYGWTYEQQLEWEMNNNNDFDDADLSIDVDSLRTDLQNFLNFCTTQEKLHVENRDRRLVEKLQEETVEFWKKEDEEFDNSPDDLIGFLDSLEDDIDRGLTLDDSLDRNIRLVNISFG